MKFVLVLLTTLLNFQISFAQENKTTDILFIGNSLTFFWNMPQMVDAMAKHSGLPINIHQSTVSGSNWKQHWEGEKGTKTRPLINSKNWNYIILQDHSFSTINHLDRFKTYGEKFVSLAKSKNITPIFYMTIPYKSNPEMIDTISKEYNALAFKLNTTVIPVGTIWNKVRVQKPDLNLYFDDKHPSMEGSYLIALIMYKALTGKSVKDMPNRLTTSDNNGEQLILSFVSNKTGNYLRKFVDSIEVNPIVTSRN